MCPSVYSCPTPVFHLSLPKWREFQLSNAATSLCRLTWWPLQARKPGAKWILKCEKMVHIIGFCDAVVSPFAETALDADPSRDKLIKKCFAAGRTMRRAEGEGGGRWQWRKMRRVLNVKRWNASRSWHFNHRFIRSHCGISTSVSGSIWLLLLLLFIERIAKSNGEIKTESRAAVKTLPSRCDYISIYYPNPNGMVR